MHCAELRRYSSRPGWRTYQISQHDRADSRDDCLFASYLPFKGLTYFVSDCYVKRGRRVGGLPLSAFFGGGLSRKGLPSGAEALTLQTNPLPLFLVGLVAHLLLCANWG